MSPSSESDSLKREVDFHNRRYASESENRAGTEKYYALKKEFDRKFLKIIRENAAGKRVLEVGCGPNINTPHWMDLAEECHSIDISEVAIEQARKRLGNHSANVTLSIMDAGYMEYEDNYFDVVCGKGIIHHMDVETAWHEIARVLKPGGVAVFIEPLGHNPIINAYRRLTPGMRSDDEHPLLMADIASASNHFGSVNVEYQHITSILSAYIPGKTLKNISYALLDSADKLLMRVIPFTRKYTWMVLMQLQQPLKGR